MKEMNAAGGYHLDGDAHSVGVSAGNDHHRDGWGLGGNSRSEYVEQCGDHYHRRSVGAYDSRQGCAVSELHHYRERYCLQFES